MEFAKNFTLPDFQAKHFKPSISPNFNSFSKKKHKKLVNMEKFTPLATNFTLPPALTGWTNSTSDPYQTHHHRKVESIATEGDDLDPVEDGLDPVEDDEVPPPPLEQEEDVEPPQVIMMVVLLMATIVTVEIMKKIFLITGTIMDLTIMT